MSDVEIVEFLLARIAEDEEAARAANGPRWASGDGNVSEGGLYALDGNGEDGWAIAWFELGTANEAADGGRQLPRWPKMKRHAHANALHAARHDPARVLAECEAKRKVIATLNAWAPDPDGSSRVETSEHDAWRMLTYLAQPYADHPDCDPAWAL